MSALSDYIFHIQGIIILNVTSTNLVNKNHTISDKVFIEKTLADINFNSLDLRVQINTLVNNL